ncbi:MAG TPA: hypothetical protein VKE71_10165 [Candidatus Angelobacter sp.]|nr:hypothetical protein [Candidatus Angelobacter sp.]
MSPESGGQARTGYYQISYCIHLDRRIRRRFTGYYGQGGCRI